MFHTMSVATCYLYMYIQVFTAMFTCGNCDGHCEYTWGDLYEGSQNYSISKRILQNLTTDWLEGDSYCLKNEDETIDTVDASYLKVTMADVLTYLHNVNITQEIRHLYMWYSYVPEVQAYSFKMLINVETISLRHNHLKRLEENSFYNLTNLRHIDVSFNELIEIGPSVFCCLSTLEDLFINNNNIQTIHISSFINSSNIRQIELSNNEIVELEPSVFSCLPNLEYLYLTNNNLTTLDADMLPIVTMNVRYENETQLAGNPWICDCSLKWMIEIVKTYKVSENISCSRPENISMKQLSVESLNCNSIIPEVFAEMSMVAKVILCVVLGVGFSSAAGALFVWFMKKNVKRKRKPFKMLTNRHYYRAQSVTDISGTSLSPKRFYGNQVKQDTLQTEVAFTELTVYGKVRLVKLIGRGAFGEVYEGFETGFNNIGRKVAIKRIRDNVNPSETESLMKECENLKKVGSHQNIVEVYGSCIINGSRAIVMELAEDGDLKNFLKTYYEENRTVIHNLDCSEEKSYLWSQCSRLYTFMWHIAKGMAYLSSLKILHRDLAARNILLSKGPIAKISDFGLSRDVYESDYYYQETAGRLPYKWMSPETLIEGRYTTKSDVWSYGILLWEMVTLGGSPYPGILPDMLISMHNSGYIMPQPSLCPNDIYMIMVDCWKYTPDNRPAFKTLVGKLDGIIQKETKQIYIDLAVVKRRGLSPLEEERVPGE